MTQPDKPSRRDSLHGHAAVEALEHAAAADGPLSHSGAPGKPADGSPSPTPPAASGPVAPTYLMRLGRRAMACEFEVLLNAGQYENRRGLSPFAESAEQKGTVPLSSGGFQTSNSGTEAAVEALDLIDRLESQLTVYRDTSEVSRLNRMACHGPIEVEPRLFALLQLAALIHQRSGGAHDITSGPLTKAWGFYRRAGRVPSDDELAAARSHVGCERLQLNAGSRTLQMPPGMEINLGSIGKGYALDRAAESLATAGVGFFLLHGGQSSVLARGSRSDGDADGWSVGLRHPLRPGQRIGEIRLRDRALGTSGAGTQFFFHEGRRLGHILDPRTGRPAEGTLSATVLARTGAEADALSTAFYVLGPRAAIEYCRAHSNAHGGLAAILLIPGSRPGTVETVSWGLAPGDWRAAE